MRKPKHDWRKKKTIAQELMITILWYFPLCFLSSTWFIGPLVWVNPHLKDDQTRVLAVRLHLLLLRLGNGSSQVRTYAHKCKYFWRIVKKGMISKCGTVFTNWRPKKIICEIDFIIAFHEFLFWNTGSIITKLISRNFYLFHKNFINIMAVLQTNIVFNNI